MKTNSQSFEKLAPHLALFFVQLMFGSAAVLGKTALQSFPTYAVVGFRVGGAAAAFCLLQALKKDFWLEKRSHYLYFALYSLFGIILNQIFYVNGLARTTASNATLLSVTIPVFAIIMSSFFGYDALSKLKVFGVISAVSGVLILINPFKTNFSSQTTMGDIFIILNSLCYAIYLAISKNLFSYYGALKSIAWVFLIASFVNVPIGLYSLSSVDLSKVSFNGWTATIAMVIFPTILAYFWNAWALARVEPGIVGVYIYLQPLFGFLFAAAFLNERITIWILLSALLIFAGVFLATRKKSVVDTHISVA